MSTAMVDRIQEGKRSALTDVVTLETTFPLRKRLAQIYANRDKQAPKAIKEVRKYATKLMGTTDVRLDNSVNMKIFERGRKKVPARIRLRMSRKRNDEENAKEKLYTFVELVTVAGTCKGLPAEVIED